MAAKSVINVKILGDNKGLAQSLDSSASKIGKFGKAAVLGFAAVGIGAAVGLAKIGQSFDKEFDKIRVGTGATGDMLAGLEDSFKNVLSTVPASFGDAGTAIADLNTRLGLTGAPLEALAGQLINLSRITGTDLETNVDNVTRVFGDWGIATDDQATSLDKVYRAAQASGIGLGDLSSSVVQFGAPLRNLGFGFDESLALLAQFNKTGVNTETVFAGLKAGVGKLAKAGEDVPATFSRIVSEIEAMGPGTDATRMAIELFGQRAGPDLADAIAGGKFEIDGMLAAITAGTDTINGAAKDTESFGEKWTLIKNRVLVGLQPLATKVFNAIGTAMDKLGPILQRLTKWVAIHLPMAVQALQAAFNRLWGPVMKTADTVIKFFVDNWPKAQAAISKVFDWIRDNKDSVIAALVVVGAAIFLYLVAPLVSAAYSALVAAAPFILFVLAIAAVAGALVWAYQNIEPFRNAVDAVVRFLVDVAWPAIKEVAAGIVEAFTTVVAWFREVWPGIKETIGEVFGWLVANVLPVVVAYVEAVVAWFKLLWSIAKQVFTLGLAIVGGIIIAWVAVATFLWDTFGKTLTEYARGAWKGIKKVVEAALKIIEGALKLFTAVITGDWSAAWTAIKQILSGAWDYIKAATSLALNAVKAAVKLVLDWLTLYWSTVWNNIRGYVSAGIDAVVGFVASLPGRITEAVKGAFDGLTSAFVTAINWIIDKWNGISFTLPSFSFDIPLDGRGPYTFGGQTFSTPNLPRLHTGGVVPGLPGTDQLTMLQAGERVTSAAGVKSGSEPDWTLIARMMAKEYARTLQQERRAA